MKTKLLAVLGIVLVIVGAVITALTGFEAGQITGMAVTMFGAGLAVANFWKEKKEEVKTLPVIAGLVCISVGAFLSGFVGIVSEMQMTNVIGYAISIALLIGGLITTWIASKK